MIILRGEVTFELREVRLPGGLTLAPDSHLAAIKVELLKFLRGTF
jgi:hypothetical protein